MDKLSNPKLPDVTAAGVPTPGAGLIVVFSEAGKLKQKDSTGTVTDLTQTAAVSGTKLSAMAAAGAVAGADEFLINKGGVSQKVTAAQIKTFTGGGGGSNAYRTLLDSSGSHTAARAAGTYWIGQGDALGITGVGTLYPPNIIYIAAADYPAIDALTAKLRIRVQIYTNDIAPTGNYSFGLYPVARPATSGGAGLNIYTLGTVVSGSTTTTYTFPVDAIFAIGSADFALPADGHYVIGMVSTTAVAASSHIHISASLQTHYT